jgi:hypothetical protein
MFQPLRRFLILPGLICVVSSGCSFEETRYPVSGTVAIGGAPAGLTVVKFLPSDPNVDSKHAGSTMADSDGKFSIGGDGKNTGLPAGEYKVTFSQTVTAGGKPIVGSGGKRSEPVAGKEAVPSEYRDVKTTPITVQVGRDSTTFAFDIKKK